jgi:hypothetical protein
VKVVKIDKKICERISGVWIYAGMQKKEEGTPQNLSTSKDMESKWSESSRISMLISPGATTGGLSVLGDRHSPVPAAPPSFPLPTSSGG